MKHAERAQNVETGLSGSGAEGYNHRLAPFGFKMGGRVAHPPNNIEIAATTAHFVILISDISERCRAFAMEDAEILG
jgi:hypothetical protein